LRIAVAIVGRAGIFKDKQVIHVTAVEHDLNITMLTKNTFTLIPEGISVIMTVEHNA